MNTVFIPWDEHDLHGFNKLLHNLRLVIWNLRIELRNP